MVFFSFLFFFVSFFNAGQSCTTVVPVVRFSEEGGWWVGDQLLRRRTFEHERLWGLNNASRTLIGKSFQEGGKLEKSSPSLRFELGLAMWKWGYFYFYFILFYFILFTKRA